MSNLIREALLDAQEVTKAAESRAKGMFIKEFSPKVKNMLVGLINEQVSTGSDQPGGYSPETDKDAIVGGKNINKNAGDGPTDQDSGYTSGKDVNEDENLPVNDELDDEDELQEVEDDLDSDVEDQDEPVLEVEDNFVPDDEDQEEPVLEVEDDELSMPDVEDQDDEVLEIVNDEPSSDTNFSDEEDKTDELMEFKKAYRKIKIRNQKLQETIQVLRNKFNLVDLFNAKLAYAYKLITQPGLTRSDKRQIAESFDAAKSVRETKIIYSTLKRSLDHKNPTIQNPLRTRNIRPVTSEKTQLNETVNRFAELAGIQ